MTSLSPFARRRFLQTLAAGTTMAIPGWSLAGSSLYLPDDLPLTPVQTSGPFYPEIVIEKQLHNDTNLIRKLADHEAARGQQIEVSGVVKNQRGGPVKGSVVEVWQACATGRYNHSKDKSKENLLDNNFQFWGRAITGRDGRYSFRTIIPGKYPGRFGRHIHYRIDAEGYRPLTTQCYFDAFGEDNAKDGIYCRLSKQERRLVTVQVDKSAKKAAMKAEARAVAKQETARKAKRPAVWSGTFDVVLATA